MIARQLAATLLLFVGGCDLLPPRDNTLEVVGAVTNASTGAPLAGLGVTLRESSSWLHPVRDAAVTTPPADSCSRTTQVRAEAFSTWRLTTSPMIRDFRTVKYTSCQANARSCRSGCMPTRA